METNMANMSAKAEWPGVSEPGAAPSPSIIRTSLFELIQAIGEAVKEEYLPESDELVAAVFSDMLETGRIKFTGGLRDFRVQVE